MTPSLRSLSRLAVPFAVVALSGCSCNRTDGALRVNAHFTSLLPGCVRLTAEDTDGHSTSIETLRAHLDPQNTRFGVERGTAWSDTMRVTFESFETTCAGKPLDSQHTSFRVAPNRLETWDVTVKILDADQDGYAATSAGGTDCDDSAATVHPGAVESCAGATDFDCDGKIGCADPDCTGKSCSDGDGCTQPDVCLADGGCVGAPVACTTPPSSCYAAAGACNGDGGCDYTVTLGASCALADGGSGSCRSDGSCGEGETNCADGIDNDHNGKIDCADPNCLNQACDDHQACTLNDTCTSISDAGCVGTANPCNTPPGGPCFKATGTCTPASGQCVYAGDPTRACDDGNLCTVGDQCLADAGCQPGALITCTTPPNTACWNGAGACVPSDGGCLYAPKANGTGCDDAVACTAGDHCTAGTCAGTPYTCTALECQTGGACQGDGGCTFSNRTGACDGGFCVSGACVATGSFQYPPANFIPSQHTPTGPLTVNCAMTISTSGTVGITSGACSPTPAPSFQISDAGGADVLVMAVQSLTVTDAGSITVTGALPLVIAVYGDADFNGAVFANSQRAGNTGAGARPGGSCGTQDGVAGSIQSGGGGGAAYARNGGLGGSGSGTGGTAGATGGPCGLAISGGDVPLLGGCPGGVGKDDGTQSGSSSNGGSGGGAVQLTAAGTLRVNSIVSASGAGGSRGFNDNAAGGGGGGSGGVVVLEGLTINVTSAGRLTANGGGGGGGSNGNHFNATHGGDGSTFAPTQATGGGGEGGGGTGGVGGAGSAGPANGASTNQGGGGGGGSAGRIYVKQHGPSSTCVNGLAIVSPPATTLNCP